MTFPTRIFLDTTVVNFIIDYSEIIFDGVDFDENLSNRIIDDLSAIMQIFQYANRNAIEVVVSKTTFSEVRATKDRAKRERLESYCTELSQYFQYIVEDNFSPTPFELRYTEEYLNERGFSKLPDLNDRRLIVEALFYRCNIFCTRDWRTILAKRKIIKNIIPLWILTPTEWYESYHGKIPKDYQSSQNH